jgi:diacylglycerol diphosphate phosphatase/phosphatidate phosphatase
MTTYVEMNEEDIPMNPYIQNFDQENQYDNIISFPALSLLPVKETSDYYPDIAINLLWIAVYYILKTIKPFERPIDFKNTDLQHPHLPDFIPMIMTYFLSIGIPLLVCICVSQSRAIFFQFANSLLSGAVANVAITTGLKLLGGRLRPDFIDRCKPVGGICTGDPNSILSGRKSWPSGHTSSAFYGLVFLSLWLFTDGLRFLSHCKWKALKNCMTIAPVFLATFVGLSRTQQYVHHPTDVISGAILGCLFSILYYFHHYK